MRHWADENQLAKAYLSAVHFGINIIYKDGFCVGHEYPLSFISPVPSTELLMYYVAIFRHEEASRDCRLVDIELTGCRSYSIGHSF